MLSIIIPTRDKASRLHWTLRALRPGVTAVESEIVVVDDGSQDSTMAVVEVAGAELPISVVRHSRPVGRSAARNAGARSARGHRLLFLDDDVLLCADAVAAHSQAESNTVARAPLLNLPWVRNLADPARPDGLPPALRERCKACADALDSPAALAPFARRSELEAEVSQRFAAADRDQTWIGAVGGNLSLTAALFDALGGYDEAFGREWGVEDLEFGYRAYRAGARFEELRTSAAVHLDHPGTRDPAAHAQALAYLGRRHGSEVEASLRQLFHGPAGLLSVQGS